MFRALALVLLPLVMVACGGGSMGQQSGSVPRDRNPVTVGPGRLVGSEVGAASYLLRGGGLPDGHPLEAGFGGNIDDWRQVHGP
jgi:hypothetical protein